MYFRPTYTVCGITFSNIRKTGFQQQYFFNKSFFSRTYASSNIESVMMCFSNFTIERYDESCDIPNKIILYLKGLD